MYKWLPILAFSLSANAYAIGNSFSLAKRNITGGLIRAELGALLSPGAVIADAEVGNLAAATERWQPYNPPTFIAAVQVATIEDVAQTVKYANENSIPFLAKNGGHGMSVGLTELDNGIQITLTEMNTITAHANNTATIQGGAKTHMVRDTLFAQGKQAMTGNCDCTGFLGPALGGGHGFLQGYYGKALDNILSLRVVLGNGTIVTVSETEHSDLWWGLRGAGAQFGIVVEAEVKIYDIPQGKADWYFETWAFDAASVEEVFEQHNVFLDNQPAGALLSSYMVRDRTLDPPSVVIQVTAQYNGPASEADSLFAGFRALVPLSTINGTLPYDRLAEATGVALNDPVCETGLNRIGGGLYLTRYNPQTTREVLEFFNASIAATPAFEGSLVIFNSFSIEKVNAIPEDSSAMPYRDQQINLVPSINYLPDPSLDSAAEALAFGIREMLQATSGHAVRKTYVNYAFGNETLPQLYGSEERVARLQELKHVYDPSNNFRFFGPPGGLI